MAKSKVAVIKTSPQTVLEDYKKLLHLADYQSYLPKDTEIALKINISWHYFYPACSTTPWQLEGVIKTLLEDGYPREKLYACHNRTVVVSAKKGERNNKHLPVVQKYGIRNIHLYENEEWIRYEPKGKIRVLDQIYPKGIEIPKRLIGSSIIHLPTMKTHVFTTMTGAMKNAFGGLLHEKRHWTHSVIHETLVDLLTIQKEIHPGIFAVMDGTIAGNGPGPRTMKPEIKNVILASADQVAIDAIASKMMGFEPMEIKYIRLAHERGLGVGDPKEIEVVGDEVGKVHWGFEVGVNTAVAFVKPFWFNTWLSRFQKIFFHTPLVYFFVFGSFVFHDFLWYPFKGKKRIKDFLETEWGAKWLSYPD